MLLFTPVYGADFSGARTPRLAYAKGNADFTHLTISEIVPCDDRMDLFAAIVRSQGVWGLDFPFSLSTQALAALELASPLQLYEVCLAMSRREFYAWIEAKVGRSERKCTQHDLFCRATDVAAQAYSGCKRVNPALLPMLYSGGKLLAMLHRAGVAIYPHLPIEGAQAIVIEVYPSQVWHGLNVSRSVEFNFRLRSFWRCGVWFPKQNITSQDEADSVAACLIAGYNAQFFDASDKLPPYATEAERTHAAQEGFIYRLKKRLTV